MSVCYAYLSSTDNNYEVDQRDFVYFEIENSEDYEYPDFKNSDCNLDTTNPTLKPVKPPVIDEKIKPDQKK
ncbi:MAG: hypothetical protein MHPSP_003707, partial [Paramarteilia canceri]